MNNDRSYQTNYNLPIIHPYRSSHMNWYSILYDATNIILCIVCWSLAPKRRFHFLQYNHEDIYFSINSFATHYNWCDNGRGYWLGSDLCQIKCGSGQTMFITNYIRSILYSFIFFLIPFASATNLFDSVQNAWLWFLYAHIMFADRIPDLLYMIVFQ